MKNLKPSVKILYTSMSSNDSKILMASAAKTTASEERFVDIFLQMDSLQAEKYLEGYFKSNHPSSADHIYINMIFDNVSALVERYLIEHRLAGFSIKSRRYVNFGDRSYHTPSFFEGNIVYSENMNKSFALYNTLVASNIPEEDSRFVLPYSFKIEVLMSCNVREAVHILWDMLEGKGSNYEEIKELGESLYCQFKDKYPAIIDGLGKYEKPHNPVQKNAQVKEILGSVKNGISLVTGEANIIDISYVNEKEKLITSFLIERGYSEEKIIEFLEDEDKVNKIFNLMVENPINRELEQIIFTIHFKNFSHATLTHLLRHRMHSPILTGLDVLMDLGKTIVPESIQGNFRNMVIERNHESNDIYNELLKNGYSPEQLVYFHQNNLASDIITTMNGRELRHILSLRMCNRAQWEIRGMATQIYSQIKYLSPEILDFFGPNCLVKGGCTEGRRSCGVDMKAYLTELPPLSPSKLNRLRPLVEK